jgi:hypothetical protein
MRAPIPSGSWVVNFDKDGEWHRVRVENVRTGRTAEKLVRENALEDSAVAALELMCQVLAATIAESEKA